MQISVDISMYPFTPEYDPPVTEFVYRLRAAADLSIHTNQLSTQIVGPYDAVMEALREAMRPTLESDTPVSFVIKILNKQVEPGTAADI